MNDIKAYWFDENSSRMQVTAWPGWVVFGLIVVSCMQVGQMAVRPFWTKANMGLFLFWVLLASAALYVRTKKTLPRVTPISRREKISNILSILFFSLLGIVIAVIFASRIQYPLVIESLPDHTVKVEDYKWGYAFTYPNDWKRRAFVSAPGYIEIYSPASIGADITFGYKDSGEIRNIDELYRMAESDAEYEKVKNGSEVASINRTTIGEREAIVVKTKNLNGTPWYSTQYYFSDYNTENAIKVWIVNVGTRTEHDIMQDVTISPILKSFRLI
jgi:heme/copper-type cytochrome/quinol oxidase subunit 2